MNMKTVKTLAATAATSLALTATAANSVTIKNFDEDLATVYVNGVAAADGETVEIDGDTVTIELGNFQSDYYFRFAPESYTGSKQLGFASWETGSGKVPVDCAGQNPATFTISGKVTVTPNVDVKGYKWVTSDWATMRNDVFEWKISGHNDSLRTVNFGRCNGNLLGVTTPSLLIDCVQRVEYLGKNYTITFAGMNFAENSYADSMALPHRFAQFGDYLSGGGNYKLTALIGIADSSVTSIGTYAFFYGTAAFNGDVGDFVPPCVETLGSHSYQNKSGMTGELYLNAIKSLPNTAFCGCSGLTGARILSPNLSTIAAQAFDGCTQLADLTLDASHLTSVDNTAFPAAVKRFVFVGAAPDKLVVGNILGKQPSADGGHDATMQIDPAEASWWALTVPPTANELAAGLPDGCLGVFEDGAGARKAWVIADGDAAGATLLETDMTKKGNEGCVAHGGLSADKTLVLTAPDGMNECKLQHLINGTWTTFETRTGTTVSYTHDGQLTRAVWSVDGVPLVIAAKGYSGQVSVDLQSGARYSEGIYAPGSEVWLTATGSGTRPRSALARWTGDVPVGQETNRILKLVLTDPTTVTAEFRPLEWVYDTEAKTITDGEYTSTALVGEITADRGMTFKDFTSDDYSLWLDFSIPIYNPDDSENDYWIISVTAEGNKNWKRVRFGEHIVSLPKAMFGGSSVEEIEGFGKTKITEIPGNFFYNSGGMPLSSKTYEAEDFVPPTLREIGNNAFASGPNLVGTLRLGTPSAGSIGGMRIDGVTNIMFLAEDLSRVPGEPYPYVGVQAIAGLTFASTNLTNVVAGAFNPGGKYLKRIVFLAHAPTVDAIDALLNFVPTTNTTIYCSKFAPGWKDLRTKGYSAMEEWNARPAGCWGIYQTADGKKRYYLVQKDSKYDVRKGMMVLVK